MGAAPPMWSCGPRPFGLSRQPPGRRLDTLVLARPSSAQSRTTQDPPTATRLPFLLGFGPTATPHSTDRRLRPVALSPGRAEDS